MPTQIQLLERLKADFKDEGWESAKIDRLFDYLTSNTGGAASGGVTVTHKDGTITPYLPLADTNKARGAALLDAVSAWVTGEKLTIGVGTYELDTSNITTPNNSKLAGSGQDVTTIKSNHAKPIIFTTGTILQDFAIYGEQLDSGLPSTQFPLGDNAITATNVKIYNIRCYGESDGYFTSGAGTQVQIFNSTFSSYFDCVRIGGVGCAHDFYNCTFLTTISPNGGYSTTRGISCAAGTNRFFNCTSINSNDSSTKCCAVHASNSGVIVELHGGLYTAANVGIATPHDIDAQAGTIKITGDVKGSGTADVLVTTGSDIRNINSLAQRVYTLVLSSSNSASMIANTTYFFGAPGLGLVTTTDNLARDISIPVSGTIIAAYINFEAVGLGSSEAMTLSLHINNTTDTTLSNAVKADGTDVAATGLAIPVTAGQRAALKLVTPNPWVTPPTTSKISVTLAIAY